MGHFSEGELGCATGINAEETFYGSNEILLMEALEISVVESVGLMNEGFGGGQFTKREGEGQFCNSI